MNQGFTLIEMLVVVLIVGVLTAIALPQYQSAVERSRSAEALVNGRTLVESMDRALTERPNESPNTKSSLDVKISGGSWQDDSVYKTKNFEYDISSGTYVKITRDLGGGESYTLYFHNNSSNTEGLLACEYEGKTGSQICKMLRLQGFTILEE